MIIPAEGLAFLISAIIEILLLSILFCILSLKLINDLFSFIFSFKNFSEIDFFNSIYTFNFSFNYFF